MNRAWAHEDYRELFGYEVVRLLDECERLTPDGESHANLKTNMRWTRARMRIRMTIIRMSKTARELDEWLIFFRAVLDAFRTTSRSLERLAIEQLEDRGFKLLDFVTADSSKKRGQYKRAVKVRGRR